MPLDRSQIITKIWDEIIAEETPEEALRLRVHAAVCASLKGKAKQNYITQSHKEILAIRRKKAAKRLLEHDRRAQHDALGTGQGGELLPLRGPPEPSDTLKINLRKHPRVRVRKPRTQPQI